MGNTEEDWGLSELGQIAAKNSGAFAIDVLRDNWHSKTNPNGYINLGMAENGLMHDVIAEYIEKNTTFSPYLLTYGEGGNGTSRLRNAVAQFLNRHLKPLIPLTADHLITTNGCSAAIEHCSFFLTNPGDGILLGQPHYATFTADIEIRPRARIVLVPFGDIDPMSIEGVSCYEAAIESARKANIPVKALMLCHPHNPLGRCYSIPTIITLMKLCAKHNLHFISDEIYALSVWKNEVDIPSSPDISNLSLNPSKTPAPVPFTSILSLDLTSIIPPHKVHILWGLSKDFCANGLRIGTIISQSNPHLIKALTTTSLYSYPSSLADNIASTLLEDFEFTDEFFRVNTKKLSDAYTLATGFLRKNGIAYERGANAAFFIWADLGRRWVDLHPEDRGRFWFGNKDGDEDDDGSKNVEEKLESMCTFLDRKFLNEAKIYLADGKSFGTEKDGWFRIVFAQPEEYVLEGLKRIVKVLEV